MEFRLVQFVRLFTVKHDCVERNAILMNFQSYLIRYGKKSRENKNIKYESVKKKDKEQKKGKRRESRKMIYQFD